MAALAAAPKTAPGPITFDHAIVRAIDVNAAFEFAARVLGLRESARIVAPDGIPVLGFFRSHTLYHCYGVARSSYDGLHHLQFTLKNPPAIYAAHEKLTASKEVEMIWGPLRHGAGHNIAFYFRDYTGNLVEYSCEEEIILNDATYVPLAWSVTDLGERLKPCALALAPKLMNGTAGDVPDWGYRILNAAPEESIAVVAPHLADKDKSMRERGVVILGHMGPPAASARTVRKVRDFRQPWALPGRDCRLRDERLRGAIGALEMVDAADGLASLHLCAQIEADFEDAGFRCQQVILATERLGQNSRRFAQVRPSALAAFQHADMDEHVAQAALCNAMHPGGDSFAAAPSAVTP
jgi:catechol 2,3-dioxygenase-like lactoylglutathione lyase family enzyme